MIPLEGLDFKRMGSSEVVAWAETMRQRLADAGELCDCDLCQDPIGLSSASTRTPEEISECSRLLDLHNTLLYQMGRNGGSKCIGVEGIDDDHRTETAMLDPDMGAQVLEFSIELVGNRLRELGVSVKDVPEYDCFECGGSGKCPIKATR